MPRVISIVSGKGGVGKTTLTANLGTALTSLGKDVLVVDADFTASNLSQHFKMDPEADTLDSVLREEKNIEQVTYEDRDGTTLIPSSLMNFETPSEDLGKYLDEFWGKDFILLDGAARTREEVEVAVQSSDEVIIVIEPEIPSVTNALAAKRVAEKENKEITGLVLNKVRGGKDELKKKEIEELMDLDALGKIPEDKKVKKAVARRQPVFTLYPKSKASKAIKKLSYELTYQSPPPQKKGFLKRIKESITKLFNPQTQ